MAKAIVAPRRGGPEVLEWRTVETPVPQAGEVLLAQTAVGVNYYDLCVRDGTFPEPLPAILGVEAVGAVTALGPDVDGLKLGDRVGYAPSHLGAYTDTRAIAADRLIPLPDTISDIDAAGLLCKGLTAYFLVTETFRLGAGHVALVHAAAGGVGLLLSQMAKSLGAIVIGTVGSDAKADIARANGCDHVILYERENFVERVRDITSGRGVDVVYDGVGLTTFEGSLDSLKSRGLLVSYGNSSGRIPPFDIRSLNDKGCAYVTRASLYEYGKERDDMLRLADGLFGWFADGRVKLTLKAVIPLADAAQAHRLLASRDTVGSIVLQV